MPTRLFPPKMMPGQAPYTEAEQEKLSGLIAAAIDDDPGEDEEEYCQCTVCVTPFYKLIGLKK